MQRRRQDNKTFTARDENVQLLLDMVMSVNQLSLDSTSGFELRNTRCSKSYMETCCIRLDGTLNLFLQKFKPMRRDRETCCKNTSNDLKTLSERPESLSHYAPKHGLASSRNWTILLCSSVTERNRESRDIQVCSHSGGYNIEVQGQSLFHNQIVSWIRIVNSIDKTCQRHSDTRGRESFGETPLQKQDQEILQASSTREWDYTPIEQINVSTDTVQKFCEDHGLVHHFQVVDEFKNLEFDNTEYWSVEKKKDFANVPHWFRK